jgi:hypothetical protein
VPHLTTYYEGNKCLCNFGTSWFVIESIGEKRFDLLCLIEGSDNLHYVHVLGFILLIQKIACSGIITTC